MQVLDKDFLIQAIHDSTSAVFVMMLDSTVEPGLPGVGQAEVDGGLVSLVGLTGPWSGTGSFCCSPRVAARLSARMLMLEPLPDGDAITDEVMDAVAELTNMIVGNIKNVLEERLGPMAINIPTVVYGRNFRFKSLAGMTDISVPFAWGSDQIEIGLCIAPTAEKNSFARSKAEGLVLQRA